MALGSYSQGGLGFGLAFTLEDKFSQVADKIDSKMDALSASAEAMKNRITNSMKMMGVGLAMIGAGAGILSFFGKASDVRAQYQAYEVQFETLLQSKQRAADMMAKIKLDAGENPVFGSKGLVSANAALLGTGKVMEEQSRRITNNLSNIIAGVGGSDEELQRMAVNLAQIGSLGKATSVDIKQFIMAGIPIYKILQDGLGKTQEELDKTGISLEDLDKAFAKASEKGGQFYKATERAAQSTKGLKAAADDARELILEGIGKAIEPYTRKLYTFINLVLGKIQQFVNTPLGAKIAGFVVALSSFLIVGGMVLILLGGLNIMWAYVQSAIAKATVGTLLHTIATKGLTAGLRQMALAAWASLGPYILVAAAIAAFVYVGYQAWQMISEGTERVAEYGFALLAMFGFVGLVIGAIAGLGRGFSELEGDIDKMTTTGIIGWFTKLAGTIEAVRQIWSTWNGETFTLTEDLAQRLEKLGILDFVLTLSTAVVRIKQFFMGVAEGLGGLSEVWRVLKSEVGTELLNIFETLKSSAQTLWGTFKEAFAPLVPILTEVFNKLFGTTESLKTWKDVGMLVGRFVVNEIRSLAEALGNVIRFVSEVIQFFIRLVTVVVQVAVTIYSVLTSAFEWVWNKASAFFNYLFSMPARMVAWGIMFVANIIAGIQTKWGELVAWIDEKVMEIGAKIANGIKGAWDFVKTGGGLFGDDDEDKPKPAGPNPINPSSTGPIVKPPKFPTVTSKSPAKALASGGKQGDLQPIIIQNIMDGDVISERVMDRQLFKNARNA